MLLPPGMESEKALLQAALDGIQDSIKIVDKEYNIIFLNKAAKQALSELPESPEPRRCHEAFFCSPTPCPHCVTPVTFGTGKAQRVESFVNGPNGSRRFLDISTFPITDGSGQVLYVIEVVRDVTEKHALEEHLRAAEKLASVGEAAASLAHEIRNPLGAIIAAVDVLSSETDLPLNDEQRELLGIVVEEARRLNRILNDFLSYSRFRPPRMEPTDVNAFLRDVMKSVDPKELASRGISVRFEQAPDLPKVPFDPDQMRQALLNIVINAVEAMSSGGELTIASKLSGPYVEIAVQDTGPGISEQDVGKIFQPFYTSKQNGTGLGLAIAKNIVQMHGGSIRVESALGQGARFVISLPVLTEKENA
jgi:signal transduction histidine kinase